MEINKINLDGTEYSVGGGGKLYRHEIYIYFVKEETTEYGEPITKACTFYYEIINNSDTPITQQQFVDYINNYNYKQYSGTRFEGKKVGAMVENALVNNYYGTYNFNVSNIILNFGDGVTYTQNSITLGSTFGDYINSFRDTITPFITEV